MKNRPHNAQDFGLNLNDNCFKDITNVYVPSHQLLQNNIKLKKDHKSSNPIPQFYQQYPVSKENNLSLRFLNIEAEKPHNKLGINSDELDHFKGIEEQIYRPTTQVVHHDKKKISCFDKPSLATDNKENYCNSIETNKIYKRNVNENAKKKGNDYENSKIKCVVRKKVEQVGNIVSRDRSKKRKPNNIMDNRDNFVYAKDKGQGLSENASTQLSSHTLNTNSHKQTPNNLLQRLNQVFK